MRSHFSRRDFLRLGGLSFAGIAFRQFRPNLISFDDSDVVRVATTSVSAYVSPSDKSAITGTWKKDDLIHVYQEIAIDEPKLNPIWYRVWGGYMWRGRLQRVETILNKSVDSIPAGDRLLAEVTVPFTQPWRNSKMYGWQPLGFRLYYQSVYWIEAVEEGPDGQPWYRILDDLIGDYYLAPALHLRPISAEFLAPISTEVPAGNKRIDLNLTTQTLEAYEYDKMVFKTNISSGIPGGGSSGKGLSTTTPEGTWSIIEKMPSKHMGAGNLMAGADDYELPGVPWTSFFTPVGHAFHGTYWHDNFGSPMSHGCVNMRTNEANWIFRWTHPSPNPADITANYDVGAHGTGGPGTAVNIHY